MSYWLGVDLGTTFVAAAVARDEGPPEMFTLGDRSVVAPSVVYLREDGELLVAEAADRREVGGSDRTAREFKRRMGDPTPVMLAGRAFRPAELMAALLAEVVRRVEETEGAAPNGVVLSHPANWGPFRRGLFEEIPRLAGLSAARLATEPEAAAYHYATSRDLPVDAPIAVYDLGGGTFDVTVLRKRPGHVEVLGTPEGIERLGGVDFDNALLAHIDYVCDGAISDLDSRDPRVMTALARLRRDCVLAKETLSTDSEAVVPVFLPGRHFDVRVTREEFEKLIRAPLESTVGALERTLRSANLAPSDLAAVLLVGGSSRIPLVERMVHEALGRPVVADTHPKYAVALGAAALPVSGDGRPSDHNHSRVGLAAALVAVLAVAGIVGYSVLRGDTAPEATAPPSEQPAERPSDDGAPPRGPSVIAQIPVGDGTYGLVLSSDGERLYGFDTTGDTGPVSWFVCDTATNNKIGGGPLAAGANAVALSGDGDAYFPASRGTRPVLSVVDSATNRETGHLATLTAPGAIAFTPGGHLAYLGHFPPNGPGFLSVYDVDTETTTARIPGFRKPWDLAASPDGQRVYISDNDTDKLSVLDTATNRIVAAIPTVSKPQRLAVSPDGHRVYYSSQATDTVAAIDAPTNSVAWEIRVGFQPHGLAVSPDGRKVYVSQRSNDTVSVIDSATKEITGTIAVGKQPTSLALSQDGDRLYVADQTSGTISVIDTGEGQ